MTRFVFPTRCLTLFGQKVHMTVDAFEFREGKGASTLCRRGVDSLLFAYDSDESPADERPVDCSRCRGQANWRLEAWYDVMEGHA